MSNRLLSFFPPARPPAFHASMCRRSVPEKDRQPPGGILAATGNPAIILLILIMAATGAMEDAIQDTPHMKDHNVGDTIPAMATDHTMTDGPTTTERAAATRSTLKAPLAEHGPPAPQMHTTATIGDRAILSVGNDLPMPTKPPSSRVTTVRIATTSATATPYSTASELASWATPVVWVLLMS